jgi:hypothetical protein
MEICHTAPNSAMLQGLKPHAAKTRGTSAYYSVACNTWRDHDCKVVLLYEKGLVI